MKPTDVRIRDVSYSFEDFRYRTPIKFGGVALDRVTLLDVTMTVETRSGKVAAGFGSMPLGNVWAWPTRALSYDQTLGAMTAAAGKVTEVYQSCPEYGHPVEITHALEPIVLGFDSGTPEPIPRLAMLVVASAF